MVQEAQSPVNPVQLSLHPSRWWQWVITVLITAVASNAPQIPNLWIALQKGVSPELAQEMRKQDELWEKNLKCLGQEHSVTKSQTDKLAINVMLCPSGDMLVKVQDADPNDATTMKAMHQWIEFTTPSRGALSSFLMPSAIAATVPNFSEQMRQSEGGAIAQVTVLCQKLLGDNQILRRLKYPDGRCVDEVVNTLTGEVIMQRESSQCSAGC